MLARITRANAVADYAYSRGMPARHTYDERILRLASARGDSYAALYDYLLGDTIPWEAYTQKHLKQLGKALSDLHAALADCTVSDVPAVVDEYRQINERMRRYFVSDGVTGAMRQKLYLELNQDIFDSFDWLLAVCEQLPDQQVLHMDFVRSNLLFTDTDEGPIVSGILDFEKTAFGSPLFDVARTLAFLLVDCKYKPEEKVRKYFLTSGYQKRGAARLRTISVRAGDSSINVLEALMGLYMVYDFYKFLRHNPYESLGLNEHYVRTRNLLLERQVLTSV